MGRSSLLLGDAHHETVERIGDLDLAAQPAFAPHVEGEVEHVLLHLFRVSGRLAPGLVDIDVTGGTGAGPAAFGRNAGDRVLDRSLHHRHARLSLDDVLGPVVLNIRDPCHGIGATWRSLLVLGDGAAADVRPPRLPAQEQRHFAGGLYRAIESGFSAKDRLKPGALKQRLDVVLGLVHRGFKLAQASTARLAKGVAREGLGTCGGGGGAPSPDRQRRAFERMGGILPLLVGRRHTQPLNIHGRLRAEELEHLALKRALAERIA